MSWCLESLLFLDEVSIDNRDIFRTHGYSPRGQPIIHRGEYNRSKRVSLLTFLGADGVVDSYQTEGTFDRTKFIDCLKTLLTKNLVFMYPGRHSVWILDGAKIHTHESIVYLLRSAGIVVLFLPAYCPFYNPIELFFKQFKDRLKKTSMEGLTFIQLQDFIIKTLLSFNKVDFRKTFRGCGYVAPGRFDPSRNY
jgi:transposase